MIKKYSKWIALLLCIMLLTAPVYMALAQEDGDGEEQTTEEVAEGEVVEGEEEEPSVSPLVPLGINLGFLIAQIVNFLLIFGLLTVMLWRPLMNMLDSRSEMIAKGLEDASTAANARRNAEVEADKILSQARTEAAQIVEEARGRGEEVAKSIEAAAREKADKIREDARIGAEAERNAQLAGLRSQVTSISLAVANRLISGSLDEAGNKQLIDDFFSKLPKGAAQLSGDVEVISAMPLSDQEQARISGEIGADNITYTVNPDILGGLIIRSGDRVIDGSVRSNMSELATRLN